MSKKLKVVVKQLLQSYVQPTDLGKSTLACMYSISGITFDFAYNYHI